MFQSMLLTRHFSKMPWVKTIFGNSSKIHKNHCTLRRSNLSLSLSHSFSRSHVVFIVVVEKNMLFTVCRSDKLPLQR